MGHRWRGYGHPELYKMINAGPGPDASHPQATYWTSLTEELSAVDSDLHKALSELKVSWEGQAADNAQSGMTPLREWATDAQQGSSVMRSSAELQADYISTARNEMPEPVQVTTAAPSGWDMALAGAAALTGNPVPAAAVAAQAIDHEQQEAAQSAAEQKAVDTMVSYESSSTWNRNTLGEFVPPPDVVVSTPPPQGGMTGHAVGSFTVGTGYTGDHGSDTLANRNTVPPAPVDGGPSTGGGSGGTLAPSAPSTLSPLAPSGSGGDGTTPSWVTPPMVANPVPTPPPPPPPVPGPPPGPYPPPGTYPPGVLPPGMLPPDGDEGRTVRPGSGPGGQGGQGGGPKGGPNAPGAPGSSPDGSKSASQVGRPGAPGLGGPGGPKGAPGLGGAAGIGGQGGTIGGGRGGAGAGGPGGAGARGGVGGPLGAGGRRGEGDEDEEHYAPDYLMETEDVFGDERTVAPPVIGGENPQQ